MDKFAAGSTKDFGVVLALKKLTVQLDRLDPSHTNEGRKQEIKKTSENHN